MQMRNWVVIKFDPGDKAHFGTKFGLNTSKIEYVATPTGKTVNHKQLKIGKWIV